MNPGDVIDRRFEIQRLAGAGGMGAVYRARDLLTGAPVALKVLLGTPAVAGELRFEREARALAELDHPGIVRYVAHGQPEGAAPYLAMEWVEGETLEERLGRGPLSVDETVALGVRLAGALGAAHARGVVHRDLKPSNVLLAGLALEGATLADFGVATFPGALRATQTGAILGTPAYMAPEQARGARDLDARADVFTLGCVLHECLAGKPAFEGQHLVAVLTKIVFEEVPGLRALGREVPPWLDALVTRMLAKDPGARPRDGGAVLAALSPLGATCAAEPLATSTSAPHDGSSLTQAEQRLACIVLAQAPRGEAPDPTARTLASTDDAAGPYAALPAVRTRGGIPAVLVDGTIAVTTRGAGLATDQAAVAAGCALALRAWLPGWAIAVATGRAEVEAERPVGDAIERAAQRIRARREAPEPRPIDLDDVTAGLLDLRFDVAAGALGLELSSERDVAEKARTLLGRPTALVGRDRELATLEGLFDECVDEPAARAVLVTAPAGAGKSRLRHELTRRLLARGGVEVWTARGDPTRAGAPFALLAPLLRHTARLLEGEPLEGRRQKLLARVSRHVAAPLRLRVAEFLGELTGTDFPDEGRVELRAARRDVRLAGDQMRRAWIDFVDAETRAGPLVIVLEDMHWGDAPSADYLDLALRVLEGRPLLCLALARPEVHERLPRLWHERALQEIRLPQLSRRASERLIRDVLGEAAPAETVTRLWERSAGNAFFLEELLRATAEGRGGELPETVLAMVESRFDALDPEDRRLLRAASVYGMAFWRGGLRALLGGEPRLDERLVRLEEMEWIARGAASRFHGEDEYAFRHALVREAAYGMLRAEDRALGHRLAGAWLEAAGENDALVLAEHQERGGDAEGAVAWYAAAADQALGANDLAAVIARVDRAVALGAGGEVLGRLALARTSAHKWRAEPAEARTWGERARSALREGSAPWCAAMGELIWTFGDQGDTAPMARLTEALLASKVEDDALGAYTVALTHAVGYLMLGGAHDEARAAERAIASVLERVRHEPAVEGAVLVARAFLSLPEDDPSSLRRLFTAAVACFEAAGDRRLACMHRSNVVDAENRLGAYAEAEETARTTLAEAERMGLSGAIAWIHGNLGLALARRGAVADARAVLSAAVERSTAIGHRRMATIALVYLAETLALAGDLGAAEVEARRALDTLQGGTLRPYATAMLAHVLLCQGRVAEALDQARGAHAELAELGQVEEGEAFVRLVFAEALDAAGHAEAARDAVAAARSRLLARAGRIGDETWRRSFLENVPENARTLALGRRGQPP